MNFWVAPVLLYMWRNYHRLKDKNERWKGRGKGKEATTGIGGVRDHTVQC